MTAPPAIAAVMAKVGAIEDLRPKLFAVILVAAGILLVADVLSQSRIRRDAKNDSIPA